VDWWSNEKLEERIRELPSELVKGSDGEEMIRYQLTELARDAGGDSPTAERCT
jgi:hypothetical protein